MIPEKSTYPEKYDTDFELKTVVDSLISEITNEVKPYNENDRTTYDWENGKGVLSVKNINQWPETGYASLYLKEHFGKAKNRAVRFHYSGRQEDTLINVQLLSENIHYFPVGSLLVQNVVAENHNYNKDAIIELQKYLGHRGTQDQSTLEWFADFYRINIKIPKPWFDVYPANNMTTRSEISKEIRLFVGDYLIFEDQTTRINPGFDINNDFRVKWIYQLGDGTKITISLDLDTQEYVFDIVTFDQGQRIVKQERKASWDKKIYHAYRSSGIYSITLTVYNENGKDSITLFDIIKVIDEAPINLNLTLISTSGSKSVFETDGITIYNPLSDSTKVRAKAVQDTVNIISNLKNNNLEIDRWIWDFGQFFDNDLVLNKPYLNVNFSLGGLYDVGLKVVTKSGSFIGAFLEGAIDIVEKPSVWLGYNNKFSGQLFMNEYSIRSNIWKNNGLALELDFSYDLQGSDNTTYLEYTLSKGFHSDPRSDTTYALWAQSQTSGKVSSFNTLLNSSQVITSFQKVYGWSTFYIPVDNMDRIYLFGGLENVRDFENISQEVSYVDLTTNSMKFIEATLVTVNDGTEFYSSIFVNAKDLLKNPNNKIAKWKTTSYKSLAYVMRNSSNNVIDELYSFDPNISAFTAINTAIPFSKREFGFDSLVDGLYIISNVGDIFRYLPESNVWTTTTIASSRNYAEAFYGNTLASRDENSSLVTGTESRNINASNTNLYFSYNYDLDAFGKFDLISLSYSKLSTRPAYENSQYIDQWEMVVN